MPRTLQKLRDAVWSNAREVLLSEFRQELFLDFKNSGLTGDLKDLSHDFLEHAAEDSWRDLKAVWGKLVNEVPLSLIQVPKDGAEVFIVRSLREPKSSDFSQVPLNHSQAGMQTLWIQKFLFLSLKELMIDRPWLEPKALASSQQVQQRVAKYF